MAKAMLPPLACGAVEGYACRAVQARASRFRGEGGAGMEGGLRASSAMCMVIESPDLNSTPVWWTDSFPHLIAPTSDRYHASRGAAPCSDASSS
jgi:hypothetical protein